MDLAELNFADRNAVEAFLQTERFRPCANLECSQVRLERAVFYMPLCLEGRFSKEGVAKYLNMPLPPQDLSPVIYMTVGTWGPLVSCPRDCNGYRNRSVAKAKTAGMRGAKWLFENVLKPADFLWAAFWAWIMR
jgi:hypothetical protein